MATKKDKVYPLLNDPDTYPDDTVLAETLGDSFAAFSALREALTERAIAIEWRHYFDTKCWLCKAQYKKKTVCWLSAWDGYFKVTCYFNANNCEGVYGLPIADAIKDAFRDTPHVGKSMPLMLDITDAAQLADVLTIFDYKKSVK